VFWLLGGRGCRSCFPLDGTTGKFMIGRPRFAIQAVTPSRCGCRKQFVLFPLAPEEGPCFGLKRTAELLLPMVERVHWYRPHDLGPQPWTATTRKRKPKAAPYYRHYYMGLRREDGLSQACGPLFPRRAGICQWPLPGSAPGAAVGLD